MSAFEDTNPAERQPEVVEAVCWECGERKECHEYVVCCTGTLFHLCDACEEKVREKPEVCETPAP